jgi:hypothetical protein
MRVIRRGLGYDKKRRNSFRVCAHIYLLCIPVLSPWSTKSYCRDTATSGRLNWDGNWKSQRSEKLSMAYKAVHTLSHFLLYFLIMCGLRPHSPRRAASKANGPSTTLSSSTGTTARTTGTVSTTPPRSVARKLLSAVVSRPALLPPRLLPPPRLVPAARHVPSSHSPDQLPSDRRFGR